MSNWHAPTDDEINGVGDHIWLIDIQPDIVPYQACNDGNALIRVNRPGWSWIIADKRKKDRKDKSPYFHTGSAETREAAIGDAMAKLGELRR
jgi:hypothetical protein